MRGHIPVATCVSDVFRYVIVLCSEWCTIIDLCEKGWTILRMAAGELFFNEKYVSKRCFIMKWPKRNE